MNAKLPIVNNHCVVSEAWMQDMELKISETHTGIQDLATHAAHLSNLPVIAESIRDMRTGLISAATGKDHLPSSIAMTVVKTLGLVIIGLVAVIFFLLTGAHLNLINGLH